MSRPLSDFRTLFLRTLYDLMKILGTIDFGRIWLSPKF